MIKRQSKLHIKDIAETKQRLAPRELGEAKLKQVGGGMPEGTCTTCCDCDC